MTKGTVLVASPSAIGRPPEASGSSVPAWPARLAWNSRFTTATAWVEVMPTGLSSTTQPWTSRLSRLGWAFLRRGLPPPPGPGLGWGSRGNVGRLAVRPLDRRFDHAVCGGRDHQVTLPNLWNLVRGLSAPRGFAVISLFVPLPRTGRRRGSGHRARISG